MPNAQLSWRRKVVWFAVENVYKTDPGLNAAVNGLEVRNMTLTPLKSKKVEQNIEQAYLGNLRELLVGQQVQLKFDVAIAGSGTAGVAPAYGGLMRCCKRSETALAVAVSGNAQAGSVSAITLAAAASAVNDAYKNMEIVATGGAGNGQSGIIKSYNGATKVATLFEPVAVAFDNTTQYSIGAQTVYAPVDSGDDSGTFYVYLDRLKFIMNGVRGNVVHTLDPLKVPVYTYTFTGIWGGYSDVAEMPTNTVYTPWKMPLAVNAANTSGFKLHGFAANMYTYSLDDGNQVVHRDDIVGVEDVVITDRKSVGTVSIQMPLKAEKDFFAASGVGGSQPVEGSMTLTHGVTAGNIVRFYQPAVTVSDPTPEDKNGTAALRMALRLLPVAPGGNDSLIIVK
ncbi:MAG: hypothetical protein PHH47_09985 [Gallionella sp.]|nr:hypothetical protein [Gallionella sp.]MDD4947205.1 hypothetical protein [Gallionella sp.]MDD5611879.1 hypothetical protein [Gallionella sp.]